MITSILPPERMADHVLVLAVQMIQGGDGEQTGVFNDHLVLLGHIEEGVHQLGVINGDDLVDVLLDIGEHQIAGSLDRHAVGDGGDVLQRHHMARFHTGLHGGRAGGLHADDLHIGVEQLGQRGLTPEARPPPPMGTRMTSTSGRLRKIS